MSAWEEQALQLLYYGEIDCHKLEDKAMGAFRNLLQYSKIERRTGYALHILELIVEYNVGN